MNLANPPLPSEIWAATPTAAQALIVSLQARVHELEARLGQDSSNFLAPSLYGPAPNRAAAEGAAHGTEAGRPELFGGARCRG